MWQTSCCPVTSAFLLKGPSPIIPGDPKWELKVETTRLQGAFSLKVGRARVAIKTLSSLTFGRASPFQSQCKEDLFARDRVIRCLRVCWRLEPQEGDWALAGDLLWDGVSDEPFASCHGKAMCVVLLSVAAIQRHTHTHNIHIYNYS